MPRTLLLACLLLVLTFVPGAAAQIVLRDTIGPDSQATEGSFGLYSRTNQAGSWAVPGLRFTNTSGSPVRLQEFSVAIAVFGIGAPTNNVDVLEQKNIQFHLWNGGVEGAADSYAANPFGAEVNGHTVVDLTLNLNLFATPLGFIGLQNDHQTFVFSADLRPHGIFLLPGQEVVASLVVEDDGVSAPINFETLLSRIEFGVEDVFTDHNTALQNYPGYLVSQLGLPDPNFAGYVSVTIPGDANGDGGLTNHDIASFVLALTNLPAYQVMFPDVDPDVVLDMNGDGGFDNLDIAGFVAALTGK